MHDSKYLGLFACRNKEGAEYQHKAIEFYTELQQIIEGVHGFDNDQNALILKMMGDCYEHLEEYGKRLIAMHQQLTPA